MSKPGPKLKPGTRYDSGRLKPESRREAGAPPVQLKRVFDRALRGAEDPRFGTVLGLLFMSGKITAEHFAAGEAYGRLRGRFDRATDVPRRTCQSPWYGDARSPAKNPKPLSEAASVALIERHTALLVYVGHRYPLLERVCVDDIYPGEDEQGALRAALKYLGEWLGMEG